MKVRKNCEKYERTVDYFIATTFQIFTALQDQKNKKKKKKKKKLKNHMEGMERLVEQIAFTFRTKMMGDI